MTLAEVLRVSNYRLTQFDSQYIKALEENVTIRQKNEETAINFME
jgi:hypothetical protein